MGIEKHLEKNSQKHKLLPSIAANAVRLANVNAKSLKHTKMLLNRLPKKNTVLKNRSQPY